MKIKSSFAVCDQIQINLFFFNFIILKFTPMTRTNSNTSVSNTAGVTVKEVRLVQMCPNIHSENVLNSNCFSFLEEIIWIGPIPFYFISNYLSYATRLPGFCRTRVNLRNFRSFYIFTKQWTDYWLKSWSFSLFTLKQTEIYCEVKHHIKVNVDRILSDVFIWNIWWLPRLGSGPAACFCIRSTESKSSPSMTLFIYLFIHLFIYFSLSSQQMTDSCWY